MFQREHRTPFLLDRGWQGRRMQYKVGAHGLRGTLAGFLAVRLTHFVWE